MTLQQITLDVPLSRIDSKPDNGALLTIATLAERGFRVVTGDVLDLAHATGTERTLRLVCVPPHCSRRRWILELVSVMRELHLHGMDIDDTEERCELAA